MSAVEGYRENQNLEKLNITGFDGLKI